MRSFITVLFVIVKSWRLPKHLLLEDYLSKMCYMFTTVRNDEVDLQIAAWVDLRNNVKWEK